MLGTRSAGPTLVVVRARPRVPDEQAHFGLLLGEHAPMWARTAGFFAFARGVRAGIG